MKQKKEVNFEYYKLFVYSWNKLHSYYGMSHTQTEHMLLPVYEHISSKVDPTKGAPSSYIFRGVRMVLRGRRITMSSEAKRKYSYRYEEAQHLQESAEKAYMTKNLVEQLLRNTALTKSEKDLLNEMFFKSMGSVEDARRSLGNPYSRSRGSQIYTSLMKKLRATMEELNANT